MSDHISDYLHTLNQRYQLGNATEHTFRGDLAQLIEKIAPNITATNEPKRQKCGAPDYILTHKNIPIGFIEAKDIGDKDLDGQKKTGNKEQFDRYKAQLNNIIFTDYLDFHIYQDAVLISQVAIGEVVANRIQAKPENFELFENLLKDFCRYVGQTIKSPKKLAEMMAAKARLLSDVIEKSIDNDEDRLEDSTLKDHMDSFQQILIHDITAKGFADIYAQTIAYGMFAARLHDPTLPTFSRQEAAELIPKTNPFLRKLFGYIAGPDIDDRIKWIVDSLAEIFLHCNVEQILKDYGRATKMEDPIIHFYETFLSEYDPKLRKARGVWYTPAPVVNFIVRAVDDILKTEFQLPQGLADTSKTTIDIEASGTAITKGKAKGKKITEKKEVHKVQILDPATGTGTFLAEVVKHIHQKFAGQQGIWSNYVESHLLPRLNGFELLMASYAMAHLQLDLLLTETGYKPKQQQRLRVYLTNSLEESHPDTGTLFANWLSAEANEANHIKRDTPVMCVIGNPPYSVSSTNKGEWIQNLIADYKKDLNERKINLDDDYIKFIRYGQYFIEKNGEGVLAYISNNSFIDGITHRQMRKNLLETFDKIYIIDLHGNTKKKETAPDGHKDENVFDIMQGVSINIFVKTAKTTKLGKVFHYDVYGKREDKYDFLKNNALPNIKFKKLNYDMENYFFVPKNFSDDDKYKKGFKMDELFNYFNSGLQTKNDSLTIHFSQIGVENVLYDLKTLNSLELRQKYNIQKDGRDWTIDLAKIDITESKGVFFEIQYKPFDFRKSYYTGNSKGFIAYPRKELTDHILKEDNLALATMRQIAGTKQTCVVMLTKTVMTDRAMYSTNGTPYLFPLYLYNDNIQSDLEEQPIRSPNLNREIVDKIAKTISLTFTDEKEDIQGTFAPIDILDYIYAVLHSPNYRETYKEFLKIDFPRVPYPTDTKSFIELAKLGAQLRQIHLLESPSIEQFITEYPEDGDNIVEKPIYKDGNVYINDSQYFANVPDIAWNFYIGGYQPAQKWLKDRKNRALNFEDILHYQKIIKALSETHRLMQSVDDILNIESS